jgi:hypothetical protein
VAGQQDVLCSYQKALRQAGRQIVHRHRSGASKAEIDVEVIAQMPADARQIALHLDTHFLQQLTRPNAEQLQQMRRTEGAARDYDLAPGPSRADTAGRLICDTDGPPALDQYPADPAPLTMKSDNASSASVLKPLFIEIEAPVDTVSGAWNGVNWRRHLGFIHQPEGLRTAFASGRHP